MRENKVESKERLLNQNQQIGENTEHTDFLITFNDLRKIPGRVKSLLNNFRKKRNGVVLIILVFYVFIISLMALMDPMLATALNLKAAWIHLSINRAEELSWSVTSPVRQKLVEDVYSRVQKQLIEHIAKSKGNIAYQCQGTLVQPTTIDPEGGKLENQFGLCDPEHLLDNLDGLNNQTIDYLPVIYPNYKTPLEGENEQVRQAIIYQNTNSYQYKFTSTYVNQQALNDSNSKAFKNATGIKRQEFYHWTVRSDIEASLPNWGNVTRGITVYYDVLLTNNFYPGSFGGGGANCDRNDKGVQTGFCPTEIDENGICHPSSYTDANGIEWLAGTGPCPRFGTGAADQCQQDGICIDRGPAIVCPLAGGGQLVTLKVRSTRPQIGCASLNSGRAGKIVDDQGYNFTLVVRLNHIGNTYN